jgi:hypothetical protein
MQNLKSFAASAQPTDTCDGLILAAHADGMLTDAQRDFLQANYGAFSITAFLAFLTSLPTIIVTMTKYIPDLMKAIQQIIDLFKNFPVPGPTPDNGGTVPPKPIS